MNGGLKKSYIRITAALVLCLVLLVALFYALLMQYQKNNAYGSAGHLIEINREGRAEIATMLERDQKVAADISNEILQGFVDDQASLFRYIALQKENWKEDRIEIYTASGKCYDSTGTETGNGSSSEFAAEVIEKGKMLRIVGSEEKYAVAIDSSLEINGSAVVAAAVVHNLGSLLEDAGMISFSGAGSLFLVRQDGVEISRSGDSVPEVYNLLSLLEKGKTENLTDSGLTVDETMNRTEEGAFLFSGTDAGTLYVILTPVSFLDDTMYLFNLVPQTTVNQTTNQFVNSVILLLVILVIFIILLFAFYLRRAGRFNREIMTRERLFDILVSETKNGFMLLKVGREKPDYVSSNTETIFGNSLPKLESAGKGYRLSAGSGEKSMEALAMVNESLEKWDGSTEFISDYFPYRANGTDQYLRLCLYPVLSEKNEYVGIIQDMTRDYKRENSLRAALEMADSANHAKSRFLSGISHDIRTPLNAIINMTRFLQEEITQEKESQQLEIILRSSEHLLELINNVLDISRIESGKITFAEEPFSIGETADGVADIIRTLCDGKQQKFLYEKKNIRHQELIGDSLRLRQVLLNLLNNAVKYTGEKGCIRFTAEELTSIKPGTVSFRFTVQDNGIGISESRFKEIFQPFIRVESTAVRENEGNGLGLAITKSIIDAMGGSVSVQSHVGEGSVFTAEIPFSISQSSSSPKALRSTAGIRFDGKCALLAEDNEINAQIARMILERRGMTVETAENGREALDAFSRHEAGYYDVIFMDIQMPLMDGYQAARAIRSDLRDKESPVPIIAMTANAFTEDVEKARSAGMNAHISKPVNPDEVYRVTDEILTGREDG